MLRRVLLTASIIAIAPSYAAESKCDALVSKADSPEGNFRPPMEGNVTGNGRLHFYSAPDARCRIKGVFVIKDDRLTVYKPYGGWLNVMFISSDGEDYVGWVPENKVKLSGQYGNNP